MAVIYLRHPVYGDKVACSEAEAQYDRGNGWEDFDPTVPAEPVKVEKKKAATTPAPGGVVPDFLKGDPAKG